MTFMDNPPLPKMIALCVQGTLYLSIFKAQPRVFAKSVFSDFQSLYLKSSTNPNLTWSPNIFILLFFYLNEEKHK